ncbi:hypothetical protein FACS18942_00510 [Planctomycetales bacterium]|nr:hypothetical protein FACS18942_00510 [Planctomycetales bacterium]
MDTIPFHCLMSAVDIVLFLLLVFLLCFQRKQTSQKQFEPQTYFPASHRGRASSYAANYRQQQQYQQPQQKQPKEKDSFLRYILILSGTAFLGFIGLCSLVFFARLFRSNFGQCAIEGLTYHGSLFLLIAGILLLRRKNYITAIIPLLCGITVFATGFDMLVIEPYFWLKTEHYTVASPKIKKPLRVVFIADIQTDRIGWYEKHTLQKIQQQNADLIILGGDYLQYYEGTRGVEGLEDRFCQLFKDYPLKAPLGVYAIAGNIGETNEKMFKDTGIEVVTDSTIFENLGADKGIGPIDLVLLSLIDAGGGVEERGLTDTGNFIVMAGHYPNYAIDGFKYKQAPKSTGYREAERAPDLMLAGHTHGGQISLPWNIKSFVDGNDTHVKQLPADMLKGFFTYPNGGHLLITRGTGMERGWAPRIRFFCPPEISVIDLLPE